MRYADPDEARQAVERVTLGLQILPARHRQALRCQKDLRAKENFEHLFDNEVSALVGTSRKAVARVIKVIERAFCLNGDSCLVLQ